MDESNYSSEQIVLAHRPSFLKEGDSSNVFQLAPSLPYSAVAQHQINRGSRRNRTFDLVAATNPSLFSWPTRK